MLCDPRQRVLTAIVGIVAAAVSGSAQTGSAPSTSRGEWPTYGGDLASTKYSPLDQVTGENFAALKVAWRAKSPDASLSLTLAGGGEWRADFKSIFDELNRANPRRWRDGQPPFVGNFKATPLMVNGVLYLNSPASVGAALDARTGAVRWVYNPKSYEAGTTTMSARWNERGVAYWTDGNEERTSRQAWTVNRVVPPEPELNSNLRYVQRQRGSPALPQGLPLFKPPYSRITAIDMNTGAHAWMVPTGNGDRTRNIPLLKPLNLPPVGGDATLSGPLLTRTLLIHALTAGGSNDGPRLVAYDKATGQVLGSVDLPGSPIGTPMTYAVAGRQYIALTVQATAADDAPELVALALP
jgi:glucose dehydrogenase